jgi:hypothetical protein
MSNKKLSQLLVAAPALLSAFAFAGSAVAQSSTDANVLQQVRQYSDKVEEGQVTSVSQLRDVKPTDWAFQALQSLVERYGCIAGYPDGTFRGNRAMTRYEFAAGLNACLDRVNELIASATADLVTKEDLAVLQRLQEEFQAELATLRGRVDALEAKTAELEANQFSTTTKLAGETIFDVGSLLGGESAVGSKAQRQTTLGSRVRLALNTSFTGKDLLRTRLQANNIQGYNNRYSGASFPGSKLDYDASGDSGSGVGSTEVQLNELWYRFPVGKGRVWVGTHGLNEYKVVPFSGNLIPSTYDMLEQFRFQAAYRTPNGAGAAVSYPIGSTLTATAGYFANTAAASTAGKDSGLTSGSNSALAQLTFTPTPSLTVAATYSRGYNPDGRNSGLSAGTLKASDPITGVQDAATSNNYGIAAGYKFSPALNLSGWAGWSTVDAISSNQKADLFNWAVSVGLPDLLKKGNYGGVSVGSLPYVTNGKNGVVDEKSPIAAQVFYSFKLSDNISVQPGVVYITNPNGSSKNDNVWLSSLKTTFRF